MASKKAIMSNYWNFFPSFSQHAETFLGCASCRFVSASRKVTGTLSLKKEDGFFLPFNMDFFLMLGRDFSIKTVFKVMLRAQVEVSEDLLRIYNDYCSLFSKKDHEGQLGGKSCIPY